MKDFTRKIKKVSDKKLKKLSKKTIIVTKQDPTSKEKVNK